MFVVSAEPVWVSGALLDPSLLSFSFCPMWIRSEPKLFQLFRLETLTPCWELILDSVSPDFTV